MSYNLFSLDIKTIFSLMGKAFQVFNPKKFESNKSITLRYNNPTITQGRTPFLMDGN